METEAHNEPYRSAEIRGIRREPSTAQTKRRMQERENVKILNLFVGQLKLHTIRIRNRRYVLCLSLGTEFSHFYIAIFKIAQKRNSN